MSTVSLFQTMLNQYLPNELLIEELVKRDWILQNVETDNDWLGGDLIVPFKGAQASTVTFGALAASNDVATDNFVRGVISGSAQPEVWGTMLFNQKDIWQHGKISEQNFLKLLPDTIEDFIDYMKQCVSLGFLNGPAFAKLVANGDSSGNITVNRPERFQIGQKVNLVDNVSTSIVGYVRSIVMDTAGINLVTARGGSTPLDCSGQLVANVSQAYFDGSFSNPLTSLKLSLLSAANGGSTSLYGQTKTVYPYLQAINVSGAASTPTTLLQDCFNAFVTIKNRGKGLPSTLLMSYLRLGYILTTLESYKGAYNIVPGSQKVSVYGWDEIEIMGPKGKLKIVAIQEMDDDAIFFLDMRPQVMEIYTNGGFRKRIAEDGKEYFEIRNTNGYQYLLDIAFMGDFVLKRPSYCGILFGLV